MDVSVGHVKNRRRNSNADEANVLNIESLLAEAEAIKDNPDAYLNPELTEVQELAAA